MSSYFRIIFFLCFCSFLLKAQKSTGPVAKYTFNSGTPEDEAGNNDAKAYGLKLIEDRFGNKKSAYFFMGNRDSYLNLGSSVTLKPKKGSVSLWVKIDQVIYKGDGIHSNVIIQTHSRKGEDFNEGYGIFYHFDVRKLHCNISTSDLNQLTVYPTEVSYMRQWYHLVMTFDNEMLTYYVNGLREGQAAKDFENEYLEGDSVLVGIKLGVKNNRYFQGTIDDILFYDRVLTPKEVFDLYNEPDPNKSSVIVKWIIIGIAALILIALIVLIIRWRIAKALHKQHEIHQLRNNWFEQENRVLTAQMDPHFIFNSLNTIQQFIIINDNDKAQLYLTKFSRLLRMILESNLKDSISLKEEIRIIEQYLEIESLRFNNVFKYEIFLKNIANTEAIAIPRFLIQPFVENAIWHGLLPKDGEKLLTISFEYSGRSILTCIVEDNGVGRQTSKKNSSLSGNKSLAISFIKQRLELMSKLYNEKYYLIIKDKLKEGQSAGTQATLRIPILKK